MTTVEAAARAGFVKRGGTELQWADNPHLRAMWIGNTCAALAAIEPSPEIEAEVRRRLNVGPRLLREVLAAFVAAAIKEGGG